MPSSIGGGGGGDDTGKLVVGTPKNDVLTGTACDDVIDGREGFDKMSGGKGNDIYFVDQTCVDGDDDDRHRNQTGNGHHEHGNGHGYGHDDDCDEECRVDEVIERSDEGYDVVYASADYTLPANVEEVRLLGCEDLNATGNGLANILVGNEGDNVLSGGAGADTYVYGLHEGDDVIDEKGAANQIDTLKLQGMSANTVRVNKKNNDLVVDFPGRDGRVTIKNWFSSSSSRVERFQFDDGTVWDEAKIRSRVGKSVKAVSDDSHHDRGHGGGSSHGWDDDHGRSHGKNKHDQRGRGDDDCDDDRDHRGGVDEKILRNLKKPVSFCFEEITEALGHPGPTLSAEEVARRWATARDYFCEDGQCGDDHGGAVFPSLKDLGLGGRDDHHCGFGFEGSTGSKPGHGEMECFRGLSDGFRKL